MAKPTNVASLAISLLRNSRRGLASTDGHFVRKCSSIRDAGSDIIPQISHGRSHRGFCTTTAAAHPSHPFLPPIMIGKGGHMNGEQRRYFAKGTKKKKGNTIDLSKFTQEMTIEMPEMGEGAEAMGVIEKWYKKEGDIIKRDEVICDIRTEMFTFGIETDDDYDSVMGKILVPEESEPIEPGTIICITLKEGGGEEPDEKKEDNSSK